MKNVLTFTMIAGKGKTCSNDCPICISKMTPSIGLDQNINWSVFDQAVQIAINHNARIALITSKGSPEFAPAQICQYLKRLQNHSFDRRELQTDGGLISKGGLYDEFLTVWKDLGLDVICLSIYHYKQAINKKFFNPKSGEYFDLSELIKKLHKYGFRVRLSCVMLKGGIDNTLEMFHLIKFCKELGVFQLTFRTVGIPKNLDNETSKIIADFCEDHKISYAHPEDNGWLLKNYMEVNGILCDKLSHGAEVYQVHDQNVCITDCLSYDAGKDDMRELIFFPPDILSTSWDNVHGSRIL